MRQMMVNICYIVINNPNNKEELLKKMKKIKDIEDHEINVQVEPMEETTKKESKRKVGIPNNHNLYVERRHRKVC